MTDDTTELEQIETTQSGSVRKADAMEWLAGLDEADPDAILSAVTPKSTEHSGSTFATPISNLRVTGDAEFIEAFAALLKPFLAFESSATRLALNVQQIEDRDSGELTDNYALYLSVAMRGNEGAMAQALTGARSENDQRLLEAFGESEAQPEGGKDI